RAREQNHSDHDVDNDEQGDRQAQAVQQCEDSDMASLHVDQAHPEQDDEQEHQRQPRADGVSPSPEEAESSPDTNSAGPTITAGPTDTSGTSEVPNSSGTDLPNGAG